jgi:hypothetical protein
MWEALGWMAVGGVIVFVVIAALYYDFAKKARW